MKKSIQTKTKEKTHRIFLDDVVKEYLKNREGSHIFDTSTNETKKVECIYGDTSIDVSIISTFTITTSKSSWTDDESYETYEEETYTVNYKDIWHKIKVSGELMTQLLTQSYDAIASVWDLDEDLDEWCTRVMKNTNPKKY